MAMLYCGVDLHAKSSNFCLVNRRGKRVAEGLVPSSRRGFTTLMASGKGEEIRVVLEASTCSRWAAGVLEGLGAEVVHRNHAGHFGRFLVEELEAKDVKS